MSPRSIFVVLESIESRTLLSAGQPDLMFGSNGSVAIGSLFPHFQASIESVQRDGEIVLGGSDSLNNGQAAVVRLNADGSADKSFGANGEAIFGFGPGFTSGNVRDIAIQSDGKIVAVGQPLGSDGLENAGIARLTTGGEPDVIIQ
jgi:uncharacterized delta-60 repeat protein